MLINILQSYRSACALSCFSVGFVFLRMTGHGWRLDRRLKIRPLLNFIAQGFVSSCGLYKNRRPGFVKTWFISDSSAEFLITDHIASIESMFQIAYIHYLHHDTHHASTSPPYTPHAKTKTCWTSWEDMCSATWPNDRNYKPSPSVNCLFWVYDPRSQLESWELETPSSVQRDYKKHVWTNG